MNVSVIYKVLALVAFFVSTFIFAQNNMPLIAEFQGEGSSDGFGWSLVSLDFNHDGYKDLVVFSPFYGYTSQPYTPSKGKVYIYYGGPNFSTNTSPAMTLEGDYPNGYERKITYIKNIGDVSGDSFDDLLVIDTIPGASGSTRYMYFYGQTDDLTAPDRIESRPIGQSVYYFSSMGDIDGDGYDDQGFSYTDQGIYKFDIQWGDSFLSQTILGGEGSSSYLCGIEGIGDINNDGYDDFAIGTVHNAQYNIIRIYYGNQQRDFTNPVVLIQTSENISRICKPLGDINGDGYADFLGYADDNGIKVWFGSDNINPALPSVVLNPVYYGNEEMNGIGYGDINGDGYDDVVGASYNQQRFAVWLGNSNMNGYVDWIKFNALEDYCYSLAMGDYNGDGFCDIATSAPTGNGHVFVYAGNAQMVANNDPSAPAVNEHTLLNINPNPFKSSTTINYSTLKSGATKLSIYNTRGQQVRDLLDSEVAQGQHSIVWDGRDDQQRRVASGIYFIRLQSGTQSVIRKVLILK